MEKSLRYRSESSQTFLAKHEETRRIPDNPDFFYLAILKWHVGEYGDMQEPVAQPRTDQDLYSDRIRPTKTAEKTFSATLAGADENSASTHNDRDFP